MNRPATPTAASPSSQDDVAASAPARARVIEIEDPMIGKQLAHFAIRARLAQGEQGTVYLAEDASLKQTVALKLLRRPLDADASFAADLIASARLQANISHQNVAKVRYIGEDQGRPYIVTEHVAGQSLRRVLARSGAMPWENAVAVMVEIVRGLQAAEGAGVLHGALTSSNVIVRHDDRAPGAQPSVTLIDFGARPAGDEPLYVAPEQVADAPATMRGDMYALGVLFHEMLTAVPPQPGRTLPEGAAPPYIRRLVAFLVRPEPRQRPSGYDELLTRLEVALVKPTAAVPRLSRAAAFAIDLLCLCLGALAMGQGLTLAHAGSNWEGYQLAFVLFAVHWITAHKTNRQSLGKRLAGVRLHRARGLFTWRLLAARFALQFWGPIAAMVLIDLELGREPTWLQITSRLGSALIIIGALWAGFFLVVLTDRKGLALHDHATDTSVVAV